MPFTPSHVAAVLPFVGGRLPPAALVIGSMTPDLFYYLPGGPSREYAHSLLGALVVDLPLALVLFAVWRVAIRRPLVDLAPRWLRERHGVTRAEPAGGLEGVLDSGRALDSRRLLGRAAAVVVAVVLGLATHLLWDAFTHEGWASEFLPWLAADIGGAPLHTWLQHVSTVVGAVVLVAWLVVWLRRTPARADAAPFTPGGLRVAAWLAVVGTGVGVGMTLLLGGLGRGETADDGLLFITVTRALAWAALVAVGCCAAWWVAQAARRGGR
jgi:membrane-bound metal-dependent hydrolase YbcI (DUF457 family)